MILDQATEEEYLTLVRAFPLVSIRDDAHLNAALETLDRLMEQATRSVAEEVYLGALTDLVEVYESTRVAIPPTSGVAALRYLMDENGLKQSDLAPFFGTPSIISEVLSGKRRLALAHMEKLAAHFGLPISVFIEPAEEPRA
jgi:HTH-type transcriptional regulator/antitoxin HigA